MKEFSNIGWALQGLYKLLKKLQETNTVRQSGLIERIFLVFTALHLMQDKRQVAINH